MTEPSEFRYLRGGIRPKLESMIKLATMLHKAWENKADSAEAGVKHGKQLFAGKRQSACDEEVRYAKSAATKNTRYLRRGVETAHMMPER